MAKSKSTTTTPRANKAFTPKSAPAIPTVLTMPSPSPAISEADSAPVAAAATPARKQSKRKAPLDDATPAASSTKKPRVSVHTEQTTVTSTSASGKKSTRKLRNVKIEIPIMSTPKGKHIVFDDVDGDDADGGDGPSEFFTPQEDVKTSGLEAQLQEDEEDKESDDDDAPEAISTSTAAAQAAQATQAAARAAEKQQDNERRKRQERDAKFKKQAETRKEQQKKQAPVPAAKGDGSDSDDDAPAPAKNEPASRLVTALSTSSRKRLDRRTLPSVLPDEFLVSDSEAEEDEEEDGSAARPKKIKFNTAARQVVSAEARHPADQRVGSTVYRVMKKQGESKLAPRGGKYSKNARQMLLARGRTVPRMSVKKSFLVR